MRKTKHLNKKNPSFFKKIFTSMIPILLGCTLLCLITLPISVLAVQHPAALKNLLAIVSQYHTNFTLFRWFFLLILFLIWPTCIRFFAQKKRWPEKEIQFWLKQRFSAILWLILFELVVNEQIVWKLYHLWELR